MTRDIGRSQIRILRVSNSPAKGLLPTFSWPFLVTCLIYKGFLSLKQFYSFAYDLSLKHSCHIPGPTYNFSKIILFFFSSTKGPNRDIRETSGLIHQGSSNISIYTRAQPYLCSSQLLPIAQSVPFQPCLSLVKIASCIPACKQNLM